MFRPICPILGTADGVCDGDLSTSWARYSGKNIDLKSLVDVSGAKMLLDFVIAELDGKSGNEASNL